MEIEPQLLVERAYGWGWGSTPGCQQQKQQKQTLGKASIAGLNWVTCKTTRDDQAVSLQPEIYKLTRKHATVSEESAGIRTKISAPFPWNGRCWIVRFKIQDSSTAYQWGQWYSSALGADHKGVITCREFKNNRTY